MTPAGRSGDDERVRLAKALSEALRHARERRGLTLEEVAKPLGFEPQVVASWEAGVTVPRLDSLVRVATALGLEAGDLTGLFDVEGGKGGRHRRFGEAIQADRDQKQWSVATAARAVGVTAATLEGWEAGRRIPWTWAVPRVARALGWHLGELDPILGAAAAPPAPELPGPDEGRTVAGEPPRPVAVALGRLLRSRREHRGWSPQAVARRGGIDTRSLLSYERGASTPGAERLGRLAAALELDLGDFGEALDPWTAASRRWRHLGAALRRVRERRGWSREDLAERSGVRVLLVRRWEEGRKPPKLSNLWSLVEALGLGLGELDQVLDREVPVELRFQSLGPALAMLFETRGLKRTEVAERTGVSVQVINQIAGGALPSLANFGRIATLLEIDLGDLDAALDEAIARSRSARLQGAGPAMWEHARSLLGEGPAVPLGVEMQTAVVLAAVRDLVAAVQSSAAGEATAPALADPRETVPEEHQDVDPAEGAK